MQTEDPPEPTNSARIDPSRPGWHLWRVGDKSQTIKTRLRQVEWQVLSSKTQTTRQKLKEWQKSPRSGNDQALLNSDPAMFGLPSLRSAQIRPKSSLFLTQICLIPTNPTQIYSNSAKTPVSLTPTRPKLGQIFIDPKESCLTLVRSNQILAKNRQIEKPETNWFTPENQYDPTWLIWNFQWVEIFLTW